MTKAIASQNILLSFMPLKAARKVKFAQQDNRTIYWASVVFLALNMVMLGSYLAGVNSYAASGYEIKKMQTRLDSLNEENKKLTIKVSEVSSIASVQSNFQNSDYVPAGTPKFLEVNQFSQLPSSSRY